jgi:hypothetical protein
MFGPSNVGWVPPLAWMCCFPALFGYVVTLCAGQGVFLRTSAARLQHCHSSRGFATVLRVHGNHGPTLSSCVQNQLRASRRQILLPTGPPPYLMTTCHASSHLCLPTTRQHYCPRGPTTTAHEVPKPKADPLLSLIPSSTTAEAVGKESRTMPWDAWSVLSCTNRLYVCLSRGCWSVLPQLFRCGCPRQANEQKHNPSYNSGC